MATFYIDPTAGSGGDGSIGSPFDSWADVTWTAGNSYLQKTGTTFSGQIAPSTSGTAGSRITISSYGDGALPIVQGGTDEDAIDLGRSGTRNYFNIIGMDLRGGTGTSRSAVYGLGGVETTVRSNVVRGCLLTAQAGAAINGRGDIWTIDGNTIYDSQIDGIILLGSNLTVDNNTIYGNDTGLTTGDGIQVATAASVGVCRIRNNHITHSISSPKQGIIFSGASGTVLIEGNTVIGGGQSAIAVQLPGGIARRNKIYGCTNGFSVLEADVVIEDNLVVGGESGVIFTIDAGTDGVIRGNTFIDMTANGIYNSVAADLATWAAYNNVFVNCLNGIRVVSSAVTTCQNNAFWQCGTNLAGVTSDGGDVTSDPLLSASYRPMVGSPLLQAGTFISYARRDINGVQRPNPPSIGAYDAATLRTNP